ncbi:Transcriptional regulator CRZ1 [Spathaspora sp. JA1]|nr:Transcriptional regulator CRZ1 [Spathaspora sp. JA1]
MDLNNSPLTDNQITREGLSTITISHPIDIKQYLPQDQIGNFMGEINIPENNMAPFWFFDLLSQEGSTPTTTQSRNFSRRNHPIPDDLGNYSSFASASSITSDVSSFLTSSSSDYASVNSTLSSSPMICQASGTTKRELFTESRDKLPEFKSCFDVFEQDLEDNIPDDFPATLVQDSIDNNTLSFENLLSFSADDEYPLSRTTSIDSGNFGIDQLLEFNSDPVSRIPTRITSDFNYNIQMSRLEDCSPIRKVPRRDSCPSRFRPTRIISNSTSVTSPVYFSNERILSMTVAKTPNAPTRNNKLHDDFVCTLCGNKLSRAANLKQHYLSVHGEERPYQCSYPNCDWRFSRANDRIRHENLHTGIRKYVCMGTLPDGTTFGCGKRFKRSDGLGRHFRTENGKKCIQPLTEFQDEDRRNRFDRE